MTTLTAPAIRVRGITKAFKDLQVCAASTSRSSGAASSPCSARTAPARPRSCGSCRRC
jgi:hypothetical protein